MGGGDRLCNKIYFSRSRGKHECSIGVLTQESELVREHLGGPLGNSHILGWAWGAGFHDGCCDKGIPHAAHGKLRQSTVQVCAMVGSGNRLQPSGKVGRRPRGTWESCSLFVIMEYRRHRSEVGDSNITFLSFIFLEWANLICVLRTEQVKRQEEDENSPRRQWWRNFWCQGLSDLRSWLRGQTADALTVLGNTSDKERRRCPHDWNAPHLCVQGSQRLALQIFLMLQSGYYRKNWHVILYQ